MSALITAAKSGSYNDVKRLLLAGANINERDRDEATALYWGACRGYVTICMCLLEEGCQIDTRVKWGSSALHASADRGHLECVQLLIAWNANLNVTNHHGDTPLHLAAYRGHADIVDALISANADPYIQNEANKTSIQEAECQSHTLAMMKLSKYMTGMKLSESLPCEMMSTSSVNPRLQRLTSSSDTTLDYTQYLFTTSSFSPSSKSLDSLIYSDLSAYASSMNQRYNTYPATKSDCQMNAASAGPRESNEMPQIDVARNTPIGGLHMPIHDYDQYLHHNGRSCQNPQESRSSTQAINTHRPLSNIKGREALELFAESLQVKLIKHSQEIINLETVNGNLQDQLHKLDEQNKQLICEQQHFHKLLAKERRKSYEVAKQQKLLERGSASSVPDSNQIPTENYSGYPVTYKHFLAYATGELCNNMNVVLEGVQRQLKRVWLLPVAINNTDSKKEWVADQDFVIIGNAPGSHVNDDLRSGIGVLKLLIKNSMFFYILKMVVNMVNTNGKENKHQANHEECLSNNLDLEYHILLLLSQHRNIARAIHYYQGSTDKFRMFTSHLVPSTSYSHVNIEERATFLVLQNYPLTFTSFMANQRSVCPDACCGLPNVFFLLILYQLLSVVNTLQRFNIVHRNIKGENVFMDKCLRPVLGNFGLARYLQSLNVNESKHTSMDKPCAENVHSLAPESVHGEKQKVNVLHKDTPVFAKADGFAVGRMFYSLLCTRGTSNDTPHNLNDDLHILPKELSRGLCHVLQQLVLNDPEVRPTARDVMISVGVQLFPAECGEIQSVDDVTSYILSRAFQLLALDRTTGTDDNVLSVHNSIKMVMPEVEADFLVNITADEYWMEYSNLRRLNLV